MFSHFFGFQSIDQLFQADLSWKWCYWCQLKEQLNEPVFVGFLIDLDGWIGFSMREGGWMEGHGRYSPGHCWRLSFAAMGSSTVCRNPLFSMALKAWARPPLSVKVRFCCPLNILFACFNIKKWRSTKQMCINSS